MIACSEGILRVTVPMTLDRAEALLAAGIAALRPGSWRVDLSAVGEADSSAIAVMLGWLRAAPAVSAKLQFEQVPEGIAALAELYGIRELLPLA